MLVLSGCGGSQPVLIPKSGVTPDGVNLSGQWIVRKDDAARRGRDQLSDEPGIQIGPIRESRNPGRINRRRSSGSTAHVFLRYGYSLKLTQTPYSLFIAYDRSVVEEYTIGENGMVNVGPIEAMRVAGWENGAFVVETMDDQWNTLTERWSLESADVLVREIRLAKEDEVRFEVREVFDRE